MEIQQQLEADIQELQALILIGEHQGEPKHLIKMYQSLIKTKKEKLKQLSFFYTKL